jgi:hypothetical protein
MRPYLGHIYAFEVFIMMMFPEAITVFLWLLECQLSTHPKSILFFLQWLQIQDEWEAELTTNNVACQGILVECFHIVQRYFDKFVNPKDFMDNTSFHTILQRAFLVG